MARMTGTRTGMMRVMGWMVLREMVVRGRVVMAELGE